MVAIGLLDPAAEAEIMVEKEWTDGEVVNEIMEEPEPLDEDVYGVGISSLIRDVEKITRAEGRMCLRSCRILATSTLLVLTLIMQAFLIFEFKRLVTQGFVHRIRTAYGDYEEWMYENHTTLTANGFYRGIPGHFNPSRFANLPESIDKDFICSVPLSQPHFFACILLIWTCTVVIDMRKTLMNMDIMLIRTPLIASARDMLQTGEGATVTLLGLPLALKVFLFFCVFLPRLAIDVVLLWLGCRWLAATGNFDDVLLNAIALEFILLIKDLLYSAVVPVRDRYENAHFLVPKHRKATVSWTGYMGAFLWLLVAFAWVFLYVCKLQQVLPDYRWDIHGVCQSYLGEKTSLAAHPVMAHGANPVPPIAPLLGSFALP